MCAGMSLLDAMLEGAEPGCTGQAGGPTGKIYYPICRQQTYPTPAAFDACNLHRGVTTISTIEISWHDRKSIAFAAMSNMHVWEAC